jgi:ABC-type nickel/cobalt efflux system permease component RcnA
MKPDSRFSGRHSIFVLLIVLLLSSPAALAHPMGNFSISHYAGIRIERSSIQVRYLIDMAEIPTFQQIQQNGLVTLPEDARTRKYVSSQGEALKTGLVLTLNGSPLSLQAESAEVIFPPGAGGLPTMKLGFTYRASISGRLNDEEQHIGYRDDNFPGRVGWKEVIVTAGPGVAIVNTSVPQKDRSSQLANYPTDLVNSPPLDLAANVSFRWDGLAPNQQSDRARLTLPTQVKPKAVTSANQVRIVSPKQTVPLLISEGADKESGQAEPLPTSLGTTNPRAISKPTVLQANHQRTPQSRFTQMMTTRQVGMWFLVVAAAIAAGLGALHALEPGHGKTIVAAYLVGSKGTAYHAFLLGMIVTISHTAGVYALGAVTLYASRYIVPEQLYPWLGAFSGLMIAALGSYLFLSRYAGHEVSHSHGPGGHHQHHHDEPHYDHDHGHKHHHHEVSGDVSYKQLLALGITGGIVPCPAALVVLLSAVALNRVAFGLFLIVAFSIGLAAVLIGVGLLMVYARKFMTRVRSDGLLFTRRLPLTSAAVITVLGVAIAIRSLITGGILQIRI